jgi:hypothetical protein
MSHLRTDLGVRCHGISRVVTGNRRTKGVLQLSTHYCRLKLKMFFLIHYLFYSLKLKKNSNSSENLPKTSHADILKKREDNYKKETKNSQLSSLSSSSSSTTSTLQVNIKNKIISNFKICPYFVPSFSKLNRILP